jgi:cell division septation protein DedD
MAWLKLVFISLFALGLVVLSSGCQGGDQSVVASADSQDSRTESTSERVEALDRALGRSAEQKAGVEDETYAESKGQSQVRAKQKAKESKSTAKPKREIASTAAAALKTGADRPTQADLKKANAKAAKLDGERVYIVQIGAFRDKGNAEGLAERLKDLGFPVLVRPQPNKKLGDLHLVRLEPTPNRAEANDMVEVLKKNGFESQVIER